ncbi:YceI family protein [Novosphingobium sp.]|uniref:YceI family protein n=1 Tax=Novosphingobium sp. TaxID=1874826 RepID=UPI00286BE5CF|nr:YceI family protein [Novosphingobium sp.]
MDETAIPPGPSRYSTAAIVLHWSLALLLVFQLGLGWRLEDLPKGVAQFIAFQLHKSIGISILLLSLARLAVRAFKPRPALVSDSWMAMTLARMVHALLYVVMIGAPLAGWVLISTGKVRLQTMLFGLVPWPGLPLTQGWHEPAVAVHAALAWLLVGLIVLHIAGALRHHWLQRDYLGRMLPGPAAGVFIALAALAGAFAASLAWPFAAPADKHAPVVAAATMPTNAAPAALPSPAVSPAPSASASPAPETASTWLLQPGGQLRFAAAYSGAPINGSFGKWDADIVFSPDDLAHSRIKVSVDLASVGTDDSSRDDMLRSDSFFGAAAHPRAVFTASRIIAKGGGRYVASGTLSLHGQQRPLAVVFTLTITGNTATANGSARLNRLAYGVGSDEWATTDQVADAVSISFRLTARRKP